MLCFMIELGKAFCIAWLRQFALMLGAFEGLSAFALFFNSAGGS